MTQQTNATEVLLHEAMELLGAIGVGKAGEHGLHNACNLRNRIDAHLQRMQLDRLSRTANASEASEHTAAVSSGEGVEHKKAIWVVCCPYVGGVKIYGAFDNAHDAEKLRSSKETGKRAEVHTSWLTYAPPPSDRAAVEGVTISVDIAKRAVRAMELCERESSGWLKYAEPIKAAIGATIIAERARASDTNDAAVELRAAAEKARKFLAESVKTHEQQSEDEAGG